MGQSYSSLLTSVSVPTKGVLTKNVDSSAVTDRCQVMISYALKDKAICQRLASYLMNEGFQVRFDADPPESNFYRSMSTAIDDRDCVVLCLSNYYAENYQCQREARYASDMHKKILMVKVNSKYQLKGWLSFIKPGKIQFELSKARSKFITVCGQIAQELVSKMRQ